MAEKGSSCFKKMIYGCGCLTTGIILFAVVIGILSFLNRPGEPDIQTREIETTFFEGDQLALNLPEPGDDPGRGLKLKLDVSMAVLNILPDSDPGRIEIEAEYDTANYILTTEKAEGPDLETYVVKFKPKKRFRLQVTDGDIEQNKLMIHLPRNIALDLVLELGMTDTDINLTGIPLVGIAADLSMGNYKVSMSQTNSLIAKRMKFDMSMGDLRIQDIQNFRFEKARFDMAMGEARLYNSGPFSQDTHFNFDLAMGHIRLQIPEETRFEADMDSFMGEYEGPRRGQSRSDLPLVKLRGNATMGGISVITGTLKPLVSEALMDVILDQDVAVAIARFWEIRNHATDEYRFNDNDLRGLGYRLLEMGRPEYALAIFELNREVFPENPKTYRAMGAVFKELGDREEAIRNLEIALEMNPDYGSARRLLRGLQQKEKPKDSPSSDGGA